MNAKDAIIKSFESAVFVMSSYLSDLTDQEMLVRPHPAANHISWQLGHIISSGNQMLNCLDKDAAPKLPIGFEDRYNKENTSLDATDKFDSKTVYLELLSKQKDALAASLEKLSESDLDTAGPESMKNYAPTLGMIGLMMGSHLMMHTGQVAVLRRSLGKPILI